MIKAERKRTIAPTLILAPVEGAVIARQTLFWTGMAAIAGGIAVTAVVIADAPDGRCFPEGLPGCTSDRRFTNLGPFLGAPLGYSLIGAGATWSLAALLNDDDQTWPWWELLAGAAVGGLSYGISAALNPEDGQAPSIDM